MRLFWSIVWRDMILAWRQGGGAFIGVAFFVVAICLFPFGLGFALDSLPRIGPGIIWVCALLASLLSLERLFQDDFEDGSLDSLMTSGLSLEAVVSAKCLANWVLTGVPTLMVAPVLAVMLGVAFEGVPVLVLALVLGTLCLTLVGATGAALTLGSRRGGALLALLVLPLQIPVLIFGVGAVEAVLLAMPAATYLGILAALLLGLIPLCLWAAATALSVACE